MIRTWAERIPFFREDIDFSSPYLNYRPWAGWTAYVLHLVGMLLWIGAVVVAACLHSLLGVEVAYTVLPNGETAGEWMAPQVARAYATGAMPSMLPALGRGE